MVTILYSWGLIVGLGWSIGALWPGLGSVGPWIAAAAYVIAFGLTMWWRFETGRWRSIRLVGDAVEGVAAAAGGRRLVRPRARR